MLPSTYCRNMSLTMKAIRVHEFGGPKVLQVERDVPIPSCTEHQVLIHVHNAGVNPVDTYIREGAYGRLPNLPYIPGRDGAGIVEKVGDKAKSFKIGDRVFFSNPTGSYAEFVACESTSAFKLADNLSFAQGAALGIPYFTAYRALFIIGKAKAGNRVLVHGASGGVGLAACQMAKAYGMIVAGTAGTSAGMELVGGNGAHHVFNHNEQGYLDAAVKAVGGDGFDVIVENASHINLAADLNVIAPGARVVVVGNRGDIEISPRLLMTKESSIIGCALFRSTSEEWKEIGAAVVAGVDAGFLTPVVDKEYSIESVREAHKDVLNHPRGSHGKIVISIARNESPDISKKVKKRKS